MGRLTVQVMLRTSYFIDDTFRPRPSVPAAFADVHVRSENGKEDSVTADPTGIAVFPRLPAGKLLIWSHAGTLEWPDTKKAKPIDFRGGELLDTLRLRKHRMSLYD